MTQDKRTKFSPKRVIDPYFERQQYDKHYTNTRYRGFDPSVQRYQTNAGLDWHDYTKLYDLGKELNLSLVEVTREAIRQMHARKHKELIDAGKPGLRGVQEGREHESQ